MSKGLSTGQLALIQAAEVKTRILLTITFNNYIVGIQLEDGSGNLVLETKDDLELETEVIELLENDTLGSLTVADKLYLAAAVKRGSIESQIEGGKQKVAITLSNIDKIYSNIIADKGDILTNARCKIEEVIFIPPLLDVIYLEDESGNLILENGDNFSQENNSIFGDRVNIFEGFVNNVTVTPKVFSFDVERILGGYSTQSPNTTYDVSCQWVFKDSRCQYSGNESTCDKTLTACQARNNSNRFGGYPSIPRELVIRS